MEKFSAIIGHSVGQLQASWDLVLWALLAVALAFALYRVLGRGVGAQAPEPGAPAHAGEMRGSQRLAAGVATPLRPPPLPQKCPVEESACFVLPAPDSPAGKALADVVARDPSFDPKAFLKEAGSIFAEILHFLAPSSRTRIPERNSEKEAEQKPEKSSGIAALAGPRVQEVFEKTLAKWKGEGVALHCDLRAIESLSLNRIISGAPFSAAADAAPEEKPPAAFPLAGMLFGVEIVSWQVNYLSRESGEIVEGSRGLTRFCEEWMFSRVSGGKWRVEAIAPL